jgi:hypothetical protein
MPAQSGNRTAVPFIIAEPLPFTRTFLSAALATLLLWDRNVFQGAYAEGVKETSN